VWFLIHSKQEIGVNFAQSGSEPGHAGLNSACVALLHPTEPLTLTAEGGCGSGGRSLPGPCLESSWREKQDFLGDLETQFDCSQFMAHKMGTTMGYHITLKQSNCLYELLLPRVGCSTSNQWGTGRIKLNNSILGFFSQ